MKPNLAQTMPQTANRVYQNNPSFIVSKLNQRISAKSDSEGLASLQGEGEMPDFGVIKVEKKQNHPSTSYSPNLNKRKQTNQIL